MITLQEISSFLPYEPLFSVKYVDSDTYTSVPVKLTIDRFALYYQDKSVTNFWLYLRPLSEIDWQKFINENHLEMCDVIHDFIDYFIDRKAEEFDKIKYAPFIIIQWLLKEHYDIFRLIERGDAIDINTLK